MPWMITFRGERPKNPVVGDAYFAREEHCLPRDGDRPPVAYAHDLTPQFEQAGRRPIMVVLPCGYHFCIDSAYWSNADTNPHRLGWDVRIDAPPVEGERLLVTLAPSVNVVGCYHGWIRNGEITGDVEGRTFDR